MAAPLAESITVRIRRSEEDGAFRYDTYRVARQQKMSVLDLVCTIQRTQDPTLAFRYSCRAGMCGSCSMRVNGRNRWTCRTQVDALGAGALTLEPLPHFPVIRDLVVDMAPFNDRHRALLPQFIPAEPGRADFARIAPDSPERQDIDPHVECITCGCCHGECSLVETNTAYLGPAALNRAFVLIRDSRDGAEAERLTLLSGHGGVWGCHTQFNCTEVCPMGISPTRAIQKLKRRKVRHALGSFFR
ncbi:MAG: succinate dehydrogenase/fumarate reductase iron-sulfur subunit [bacterium]